MDMETIKQRVKQAMAPLTEAKLDEARANKLLFSGKRADAGRNLPPYYLVYFLLVDLLGFRSADQWEKTAWSVTVELDGTPFLIEHRKFGLGIFGDSLPESESTAAKVAACIHRAVKAAQPYFDWRASEAARQSHLNVVNRSSDLFARLDFYLGLYDTRTNEASERAGEAITTKTGPNSSSTHYPEYALRREARWFALSAIEAFFSWTEHVFIHIAILRGLCSTGEHVAALAGGDWADKYKAALDLTDADDKRFYDDLVILRRQLRNFIAHGSFGKEGEALQFHSSVGAVPMLLPYKRDKSSFRFGAGLDLRTEPSIELIRAFIDHLWTGTRSPARIYLQEYELPLVLTHVGDGTYADAMRSDEDMEAYARYFAELLDRYANMDF